MIRTILVVLAVSSDAGDEWISLSSGWTDAHSLVVLSQALGPIATTHLAMSAGIHAVFVQTGLVIRTVGVDLAFRFVALNLWVTTPTSWTEANRSGVLYATLGISGTWVGLGTRILAAFIDAGRGRLAFRIVGAASLDFRWLVAVGEWISLCPLGTAANGAMLLGQTLGASSTRRCIQAGIDTVSATTGFRILALIM